MVMVGIPEHGLDAQMVQRKLRAWCSFDLRKHSMAVSISRVRR